MGDLNVNMLNMLIILIALVLLVVIEILKVPVVLNPAETDDVNGRMLDIPLVKELNNLGMSISHRLLHFKKVMNLRTYSGPYIVLLSLRCL